MERQILPDEYYRSRERKWSLQTVNGLVREEIRTKAIMAFMDHIYAALEEATKHSGGRSPIVMNKSPTSTWRIDPLRNLRHWRKWDSWSSLFLIFEAWSTVQQFLALTPSDFGQLWNFISLFNHRVTGAQMKKVEILFYFIFDF